MKIEHHLLVKPISINECWQGRRFKTKKYDAFIVEMLAEMPRETTIDGLINVEIILCLKSILRSDVDNFCKPIIDCIVKKKWITDDRYIQNLKIHKVKQNKESISIFIESI